MANQVYANNREIACKKASGKAICAFPDVCFTPPQTPATPPGVPIPYPNTGMASDTTKGSKKTKISGKEIMLKNQSHFKTSYGDEAGCAPKKGLLTSKNKGKIYFNSWSMDVKVEGKNAVRHLDLTTHNHASLTGQTPTWPYADRMAMAQGVKDCAKERKAVDDKCEVDADGNVKCPTSVAYERRKANHAAAVKNFPKKSPEIAKAWAQFAPEHMKYAERVRKNPCNAAARCMLVPWDKKKCCAPQTPHHLVPKASFYEVSVKNGVKRSGCKSYNSKTAPCICATGTADTGAHAAIHAKHDELVKKKFPNSKTYTCSQAEDVAAEAAHAMFPECSKKCIKAQLRKVHRENGKVNANARIKVSSEESQGATDAMGRWKSG